MAGHEDDRGQNPEAGDRPKAAASAAADGKGDRSKGDRTEAADWNRDGSAQQTASIRRFALTVVRGPDAGVRVVSTGEHLVVGTHASADLRLTDKSVSRFHCELTLTDKGLIVQDIGSRNGTFVDRVSVERAYLRDNMTLDIGDSSLRFSLEDDHTEVPLHPGTTFGAMVGASTVMRALFAKLAKAAASDATILLGGETGTGKEAAAESVHLESPRVDKPFVVVDCAAMPANLLEEELFGHEKGAFTGAVAAREGAFEAADGGTIFIDEIGELPIELQPKLLRVLEQREVRRIGSNRPTSVDVRIVAATNRDLRAEVTAKRFRSDLFFRLAVIEARLPPIRERLDDIPLLAAMFLERLADSSDAATEILTPALIADLRRHSWPGNVRELRNYLERCVVMQDRVPPGLVAANGIPGSGAARFEADDELLAMPIKDARRRVIDAFESRYLEALLAREDGNVSAAARRAGVDRIHFYRLLWRHGLR